MLTFFPRLSIFAAALVLVFTTACPRDEAAPASPTGEEEPVGGDEDDDAKPAASKPATDPKPTTDPKPVAENKPKTAKAGADCSSATCIDGYECVTRPKASLTSTSNANGGAANAGTANAGNANAGTANASTAAQATEKICLAKAGTTCTAQAQCAASTLRCTGALVAPNASSSSAQSSGTAAQGSAAQGSAAQGSGSGQGAAAGAPTGAIRTASKRCCVPLGGVAMNANECCDAGLVETSLFASGTTSSGAVCTLKANAPQPCGYAGSACCEIDGQSASGAFSCGNGAQRLTCSQITTAASSATSNGTAANQGGVAQTGTTQTASGANAAGNKPVRLCRPCGGFNQFACSTTNEADRCGVDQNGNALLWSKPANSKGFGVCCTAGSVCDGSASLQSGSVSGRTETETGATLAEKCAQFRDCASCINANYACGFCNGSCVAIDAESRTMLPREAANQSAGGQNAGGQGAVDPNAADPSTNGNDPSQAGAGNTAASGSNSVCRYNPNQARGGLVIHLISCEDYLPRAAAPATQSGGTQQIAASASGAEEPLFSQSTNS